DDLRESPALNILKSIDSLHPGLLIAVEPNIKALPSSLTDKVKLMDLDAAVKASDIVVILVDHKEFKGLVINDDKIVIDTKGVL
ncbi:MAG TPA: UDP-N-acetyl-D-mannosamine dehydrogenase, partial [Chromatiaceae bacterium]|nr:UDP-N-acetyl-D-mannosamine dehydrogenase [Chromatiaceae bacterium]